MSELSLSHAEFNPLAERLVLGGLLGDNTLGPTVWATLEPSDFVEGRHQLIANAMLQKHLRSEEFTAQTLSMDFVTAGRIDMIGLTYLADLLFEAVVPDQALKYAPLVKECSLRREFTTDLTRVKQLSNQPDTAYAELAVELMATAEKHVTSSTDQVRKKPLLLSELLELSFTQDVLIPGLLSRQDRYVFTGWEGLGKTEYVAQLAICAAAGLNPFTGETFTPLRVQVWDLENSRAQLAVRYRRIVPLVEAITREKLDKSLIAIDHPEGDPSWLKPQNVSQVWSLMDQHQPDVLLTGSLYKMYRGASVNDEAAAGQLTAIIDETRSRFNCAVVLEAHSAKTVTAQGVRTADPRGSSALLGWPEFGHALVPSTLDPGEEQVEVIDVKRWRGDRVMGAQWPRMLRRGKFSELPWVPVYPHDIEMLQIRRDAARERRNDMR